MSSSVPSGYFLTSVIPANTRHPRAGGEPVFVSFGAFDGFPPARERLVTILPFSGMVTMEDTVRAISSYQFDERMSVAGKCLQKSKHAGIITRWAATIRGEIIMYLGWLFPVIAFSAPAVHDSAHHFIAESAFPAPMALLLATHFETPAKPRTLSQQYDTCMKKSAKVRLGIASESVVDLVELYRSVSQNEDLKSREKRKMQNRLAIRMARFHTILVRDFKRGERKRKRILKYNKKSPREIEVPQAGAGVVSSNALELIQLIQNTIEPESWKANGGLGTIDLYRPLNALVIRNTLRVHKQIGGARGK